MNQVLNLWMLVIVFGHAYSQKPMARDPLAIADSLYMAGNYRPATSEYEKALKREKSATAQSWTRLGISYHNLREYAKALDAFHKAKKINARFPGLSVGIAKTYCASGDI